MQGLNPFSRMQGEGGRPVPVRSAPARPVPAQQRVQRRDPAPSRLQYRLERMWLRPLYRRFLRIGLPAFVLAMTVGIWLSDEDRRAMLSDGIDGLVDKVLAALAGAFIAWLLAGVAL